jgi:hypothetical protein
MPKFVELCVGECDGERGIVHVNMDQVRFLRPVSQGGTAIVFDHGDNLIVEDGADYILTLAQRWFPFRSAIPQLKTRAVEVAFLRWVDDFLERGACDHGLRLAVIVENVKPGWLLRRRAKFVSTRIIVLYGGR